MRTEIYHNKEGEEVKVEYDENAPCIICGEPVIGASMGGTNICGACDCGNCRYCGMKTMVFREEIDGGESHKSLLHHMEWHKQHTPELVEQINSGLRRLLDKLEVERALRGAKL